MKAIGLLKLSLLLVLALALVAPFTFLKPEKKTVPTPVQQLVMKKQPSVEVKKVIEKPLHQVKLPDFGAIAKVVAWCQVVEIQAQNMKWQRFKV